MPTAVANHHDRDTLGSHASLQEPLRLGACRTSRRKHASASPRMRHPARKRCPEARRHDLGRPQRQHSHNGTNCRTGDQSGKVPHGGRGRGPASRQKTHTPQTGTPADPRRTTTPNTPSPTHIHTRHRHPANRNPSVSSEQTSQGARPLTTGVPAAPERAQGPATALPQSNDATPSGTTESPTTTRPRRARTPLRRRRRTPPRPATARTRTRPGHPRPRRRSSVCWWYASADPGVPAVGGWRHRLRLRLRLRTAMWHPFHEQRSRHSRSASGRSTCGKRVRSGRCRRTASGRLSP